MHNTEYYLNLIKDLVFENSTRILSALVILLIGFWAIKRLVLILKRIMESKDVDDSLSYFIQTLVKIGLKILLIFTVLDQAGVNTTSFIAALGAAGLAIGLALQGSLSNFAGGALILFFRPFKVGDFIQAQGEKGEVKEIQIFVTKIVTPEGKLAIIPNGALSNGNIINFTNEGKMRVDVHIGIAYSSDIKKAREILLQVLQSHPLILKDPEPMIAVAQLGDSSINLIVRSWTDPDNYWKVFYEVTEQSKESLDKAGIIIPFPQREVKIVS